MWILIYDIYMFALSNIAFYKQKQKQINQKINLSKITILH